MHNYMQLTLNQTLFLNVILLVDLFLINITQYLNI